MQLSMQLRTCMELRMLLRIYMHMHATVRVYVYIATHARRRHIIACARPILKFQLINARVHVRIYHRSL